MPDYFNVHMEKQALAGISALGLAHMGDGVFELLVRSWLCLHGKGGRKEEAESFAQVVCPKGWQVLAIDLPGHGARSGGPELFTPWHAVPELRDLLSLSGQKWNRLALRAVSLGAWFSLLAFGEARLEKALFVSPVLDMEALIGDMMAWAGVDEDQLRTRGEIPTAFGETLSWRYLQYVRAHRVRA